MTKMDQVFIMLRSIGNTSTSNKPTTICSSPSLSSQSLSSSLSSSSSCTVNARVKRHPNPNKSISLHWIVLIWLAAVLPSSLKYHAHGLDELHIGGIFPIGGKGGWVSSQMMTVLYENAITKNKKYRNKKQQRKVTNKFSLLLIVSFYQCNEARGPGLFTSCRISPRRCQRQVGFIARIQAYSL